MYHFMFDPEWQAGCKSCSFWADNFNGIDVHLAHRDTTLLAVSRAPYAKLAAYQQRMGWSFKWVSSFGSDFNYDYGVSFTPEQVARGEVLYNYDKFKPSAPSCRESACSPRTTATPSSTPTHAIRAASTC